MKKEKDKPNTLFNLHEIYSKMASIFREKVCEDCNWSQPTFYRKMRTRVPINRREKGRHYLSLAEERRIIEIKDEMNDTFVKTLDRCCR